MTTFIAIMPVLRVLDLQRSITWYTDVLGFSAVQTPAEDDPAQHCFVGAGDAELLLSTGTHLGSTPSFSGTLYFRVHGVEELWQRVSERATVVWPLGPQDYGTVEFGIRDPDGYVLAFAEEQSE